MKLIDQSESKLVFRGSPSPLISWAVLAGAVSCWGVLYFTVGSLIVKLLCIVGSVLISLRLFEHWRELTLDKLSGNLLYKDDNAFQYFVSPGAIKVVKLKEIKQINTDFHNDKILFYCNQNKHILADFDQDKGLLESYDPIIRKFLALSIPKIDEVEEPEESDIITDESHDISMRVNEDDGEEEQIEKMIEDLIGFDSREVAARTAGVEDEQTGRNVCEVSEKVVCLERNEKGNDDVKDEGDSEDSFEKLAKDSDNDGLEIIECENSGILKCVDDDDEVKSGIVDEIKCDTSDKKNDDLDNKTNKINDDDKEDNKKDDKEDNKIDDLNKEAEKVDLQPTPQNVDLQTDPSGEKVAAEEAVEGVPRDRSSLSSLPTSSSYSIIDMTASIISANEEDVPTVLAEKDNADGDKAKRDDKVAVEGSIADSKLAGDGVASVENVCTENVQNVIEKVKGTELVAASDLQDGKEGRAVECSVESKVDADIKVVEDSVEKVDTRIESIVEKGQVESVVEDIKTEAQDVKGEDQVDRNQSDNTNSTDKAKAANKPDNDKAPDNGGSQGSVDRTGSDKVADVSSKTNEKDVIGKNEAKSTVEVEDSGISVGDSGDKKSEERKEGVEKKADGREGSFEDDFELVSKEDLEEVAKVVQ